ncbi:hypothetical protein CWS72_24145 [Telmatospirillum siberiense]|uniref:Uncharacterized protein n=1 Tax=Telmatospirillum siberiense TaxID=382514 RepID=A0A2N3PNM0_9PROT|nr:hypothetical protein CWS72_24145 [Telmatospirillum siberiense]
MWGGAISARITDGRFDRVQYRFIELEAVRAMARMFIVNLGGVIDALGIDAASSAGRVERRDAVQAFVKTG